MLNGLHHESNTFIVHIILMTRTASKNDNQPDVIHYLIKMMNVYDIETFFFVCYMIFKFYNPNLSTKIKLLQKTLIRNFHSRVITIFRFQLKWWLSFTLFDLLLCYMKQNLFRYFVTCRSLKSKVNEKSSVIFYPIIKVILIILPFYLTSR